VLSGNQEAMAKLSMRDLEKILAATLTGMSVDEFNADIFEFWSRIGRGENIHPADRVTSRTGTLASNPSSC
jgi:hypothetical protein